MIEAEPALTVTLVGDEIDAALAAVANFVDLKSPYFLGHARAVADLAGDAAAELGPVRRGGPHGAPLGAGDGLRPARRVELDLGQARVRSARASGNASGCIRT